MYHIQKTALRDGSCFDTEEQAIRQAEDNAGRQVDFLLTLLRMRGSASPAKRLAILSDFISDPTRAANTLRHAADVIEDMIPPADD